MKACTEQGVMINVIWIYSGRGKVSTLSDVYGNVELLPCFWAIYWSVWHGQSCFRTNFDFPCSRLGIKQSNTQIYSFL
uniref:Uncharacterized protein n=1 Tax=Glycine max TaxID=3847 RepID=C6T8F2_SOYBN|nr:unknown [Glycine max]